MWSKWPQVDKTSYFTYAKWQDVQVWCLVSASTKFKNAASLFRPSAACEGRDQRGRLVGDAGDERAGRSEFNGSWSYYGVYSRVCAIEEDIATNKATTRVSACV